ncbi:MAG: radical SAM protein [bacterium]
MIGITRLLCGVAQPSDPLRYGRKSHRRDVPSERLRSRPPQFSEEVKPVIVWNTTQTCNLHCAHCYSQSENRIYPDELTTEQARDFIEDVAAFGAPVLLFSGGEPLMRPDLMELGRLAVERGMRAVISTNGTLITPDMAREIKRAGFSYVGISIDGIGETNDRFRGHKGAFEAALQGIRNCRGEGVRVGLRFTISKRNYREIPAIFDLLEKEDIPRCCFHHLVYSGRGGELVDEDLTHEETRDVMDLIFERTLDLYRRGIDKEILTVDNHADGVYLYLRLRKENTKRAEEVYELLKMNGGNSSGWRIGCVSWNGEVYADQFWRTHSFGNVKVRPFSEIWLDTSDELMAKLRNKRAYVKGRCAICRWLEVCGGNFRARAEAVTGDPWEADPACYLTDSEIQT